MLQFCCHIRGAAGLHTPLPCLARLAPLSNAHSAFALHRCPRRVARLYERRLHRRQRAAAGVMRSTAGAEEGNCGEVEGEVNALTSLSESDNESAIGF